jgi:hypothetical protein
MGVDKAANLGPSPIRITGTDQSTFSLPTRDGGVAPVTGSAPDRRDQVSAYDEVNGNRPVQRTFVPGARIDSGRNGAGEEAIRGVNFTGAIDPRTKYTVNVNGSVGAAATRAGDDGAINASIRWNPNLQNGQLVAPEPVVGVRATLNGNAVGLKQVGAFVRVERDPNAQATTSEVGIVVNPAGAAGTVDGQQRQQGVNVAVGRTDTPNGASEYAAVRSSVPLGPGVLIGDLKIPMNQPGATPTGFLVYAIGSSDKPSGAWNIQFDVTSSEVTSSEQKIGVYYNKTGL